MHRMRAKLCSLDELNQPNGDLTNTQKRLGGAGRDRTDDLKLAKLALSQLSYGPEKALERCTRRRARKWWAWIDSNYRPHAYQACALTT